MDSIRKGHERMNHKNEYSDDFEVKKITVLIESVVIVMKSFVNIIRNKSMKNAFYKNISLFRQKLFIRLQEHRIDGVERQLHSQIFIEQNY